MTEKETKEKKKEDFSFVSYVLGIVSVVMILFVPLAAVVLGIIGIIYSKKQKTILSDKGRKLSLIGIILGTVVFTIFLVLSILIELGLLNLGRGSIFS